jgi:hypothetical protein
MGHFTYALTLASAISGALALYDRKTARDRMYRGMYLFASFLCAIFAIGWMMYFINP